MVRVQGSSGVVRVTVLGIVDTMAMLRRKNIQIATEVELETAQTANFAGQEVQESIMGNRAEERSIDSGFLANNIEVEANDKLSYVIKPSENSYPTKDITAKEVALFLENGTVSIAPRQHFANTRERLKPLIKKRYDGRIKFAIS